ncbi:MAG TPA: carbamoyl-phosphate synthase large subunit, partial [Synergistetes bacterium]|nr:carbamoyl-phosphate synthase large subunit [Synergistota bacterium]
MSHEKKPILVLGSGPIRIGQAAEFDYSGSQACRALRDRGYRSVLLNSNPATIQTDTAMADVVYIRPLKADVVEEIIRTHRPGGVIATLGGQVALNLCVELREKGVWERYGVEVLGTSPESVQRSEGREDFRQAMVGIGEPVIESAYVDIVDSALAFAGNTSFPLIIRPDYTLGGTGGGVAFDATSLRERVGEGIRLSPVSRVLVERYLQGWREIELEVIRDSAGNRLCVCGMENVDPMGVHTGDSIVVAPVLTLSDRQWQRLRSSAFRIVDELEIRGACNVQLAISPDAGEYAVIEVNPRASRSSALASKATGYPIARIAARIALGDLLTEMPNPVTKSGSALSEPAIDYVVTKFPRWPFEKFPGAEYSVGTRMKSTGEVMAIGRTFIEATLKAVRSLDLPGGLFDQDTKGMSEDDLLEELSTPTHKRLWAIMELLDRGALPGVVSKRSGIHPFFIDQLLHIPRVFAELREKGPENELLSLIKEMGVSDADIASCLGIPEGDIRRQRIASGIVRGYREVDGCAGEAPAESGYYYGSCGVLDDGVRDTGGEAFAVIGSGPIRIGQGVEFDYCCVKAVEAIRRMGKRAVMINNNPETVSTDHDMSDALYFEPLAVEDILPVLEREKVTGVFAAFGGQTSLKTGLALEPEGVKILGSPSAVVRASEERGEFSRLLDSLGIPQPLGFAVSDPVEGLEKASIIDYPVMVRPSFVIGGLAMRVASGPSELASVLDLALEAGEGQSVLIDRFLPGSEFEVDVVCDGNEVVIPGIFEHLDPAGVHSGDSVAIFPDVSLSSFSKKRIEEISRKIALGLGVRGLLNIQFVISGDEIYVIEANPR